jgi:hypothetical protein
MERTHFPGEETMGSRGMNSQKSHVAKDISITDGKIHHNIENSEVELFEQENITGFDSHEKNSNSVGPYLEEYKPCACCGAKTIPIGSVNAICEICGWQDDRTQNSNPDYTNGVNKMSLNQAKQAWAEGKPIK